MPGSDNRAFLEVSEGLNDNIREVAAALQKGALPSGLVQRARAQALAGLTRLRGLMVPPGTPTASNAAKVTKHLDLFVTLVDSLPSNPALSGKLLEHLLEEQVEITAEERISQDAALPAVPASPPQAAPSPAPLGGGRKPLTVGSLIGR
jgi:hypothetical protein